MAWGSQMRVVGIFVFIFIFKQVKNISEFRMQRNQGKVVWSE